MDDAASDAYFEVTVDDGAVPPLIEVSGELDAASSVELGQALDSALSAGSGLTLDLGRVTFIDSSALRVVMLAAQRAQADPPQPLTVSEASDAVRRIFEITGVSALLSL